MQRTKLSERVLPVYSKGEEIFNMVSHIAGAALGIAALVLCVLRAASHHNIYGIVASCVFGASIIILYTMSSLYHGFAPHLKAKKVFQVFDHCTIFLLIAGSYTPFCLCALREYDALTGWLIFGVVWLFAVIGITLNAIDLQRYKKFSLVCYLVMGWCIIVKANILPAVIGRTGVILLVAGGLAYTLGAVLYVLGGKRKWLHSIFHIACVIGTLLHVLCILFYVV